jgi:tRNA(Glu) U13 pseudouridine synthase TruD
LEASDKIEPINSLVVSLKKYFDFPYISAKAAHYKYGTPRFFEFELSEEPINKIPTGEIDGFINLIFSETLSKEEVIEFSHKVDEAILFGLYKNTKQIKEDLLEIQKIQYVINSITDDRVAIKELRNILAHQIEQLNHHVLNKLHSADDDVIWIFNGEELKINSITDFNSQLSKICEEVYSNTPIFKNELVNRHKLSGAITTARKNFFEALLSNWEQEDLGFPKEKFPAEKTIYLTLLEKTGIHQRVEKSYLLTPPEDKSFQYLWEKSEEFLNSAKISRKKLIEFINIFSLKPFKLKHGFLEFWLPLFLFIKRENYALFGENGYIPFMTPEVIELIIKKPDKFQIKTFDVTGIKLDLFNKYRALLDKKTDERFSNESFIETIRPFLTFYKELPEYSKKTKRLSKSALALREAIASATDPEKTFFEDFPRALGYTDLDLRNYDHTLEDYVFQLQNGIRELRGCFDNLINRIEEHFLKELGYLDLNFDEYKIAIKNRYKSLKQHLLLPYQKTFYIRLLSELNERNTWINSIVHALIGKSLEMLRDEEEELLFEKLSDIFQELDNLCEIGEIDFDETKEDVLKLAITSYKDGTAKYLIRVPKNKNDIGKTIENNLKTNLSKNRKVNIVVLTKLLREELYDE